MIANTSSHPTDTLIDKPAKNACYHCGEDCSEDAVVFDDKPFCCQGCRMVYEILQQNDLCQFYEIEENAGVSLKGRKLAQYAWLDDEEVAGKILDFNDGRIAKVAFYLPQIHCASCIWLLENLYKLAPGIRDSKVNFLRKEAAITFNPTETSLRKIVELLASIGYAPELNLATLEKGQRKAYNRRLIYQLGVAGFAFGNIMLLSFPEYLGLSQEEETFRMLFGYINILLALPVLLYAGQDYLKSAWHSLRTRNPGIDLPLALGMTVLFARSAYEIISGTGAGYMDSLAGLVFFLLIGKWYQSLTYHRLSFDRDYKSYFPVAAVLLEPGEGEKTVALNKLKPGDTIRLRHGEIIPADGILKKGRSRIDYSFVTGESELVEKRPTEEVFAGGRHNGSAVEVLLTKAVSQSYLTRLWNDHSFKKEKLEGTSQLADRAGRYFTIVILLIAFATLIFWLPKDRETALFAFTAVLIIACPCALALNIPFTLGNAVRILSQRGFYLKNTNVIEVLSHVDTVIFDKTGTLTYSGKGALVYEGKTLREAQQRLVKTLVRQSTHPMSKQLDNHFGQAKPYQEVGHFAELPGKGISGEVNGHHLRIGSASFILGQQANTPNFAAAFKNTSGSSVCLEIDGEFWGCFQLRSSLRNGASAVLRYFRSMAETFLLTGDNDREKALLQAHFAEGHNNWFFANQSPADKLNFVKQKQKNGHRVLFIGDGLNDAGALSQSNVGMAISENANNFTPACDAILDARRFQDLPVFMNYVRSSLKAVYKTWIFAAIYNVIGLSFAVTGTLSPLVAAILMPASSLSIVLIGVGLTTLEARRKLGKVPLAQLAG